MTTYNIFTLAILSALLLGFLVPVQDVHAQYRYRNMWDREGESEFDFDDYREWRRESNRVRDRIEDLDDDPVENLPIPVLFGVEVHNLFPNFGDPRDGGARTHKGLDMLAPSGTPIVSPTEAVVLRIGRGSSSGHYVYTANPGDETFAYLHLDEVVDGLESGDELDAGDIIGFVGDTGNASGGPAHLHFEIREDREHVDPFPRLTKVFDLEDKINSLEDILDDISDEDEFAEFLVAHFASVFVRAQSEGIELPDTIEDALMSVSLNTLATPSAPTNPLDLDIGSRGDAVIALQTLLIAQSVGSEATRLASAGATGYFGPLTQAALAEYQRSVGITPSSGYYGPITRAHIAALGENVETEVVIETAPDPALVPSTDLTIGARGEAVVWLQDFLTTKQVGGAATNLAAVGATGYFGPLTQAALAEYQAAVGVAPPVGYFGPLTRGYIIANE